jgi:hypothetical protein
MERDSENQDEFLAVGPEGVMSRGRYKDAPNASDVVFPPVERGGWTITHIVTPWGVTIDIPKD